MNIELTGEYHTDVNLCLGRIDELKAHVERLRNEFSAMIDEYKKGKPVCKLCYGLGNNHMEALMSIPAQSLNHIRVQVEEETIQADIEFLDDMACEHSGNLNNRTRKYKEQSDD